jgi:integrase
LHRGKIRVRWKHEERYFGLWDDPAAWKRFERWREKIGPRPSSTEAALAGLLERYLEHARSYYRHPDGTPTSEYRDVLFTITDLLRVVGGDMQPADFTPAKLKEYRAELVSRGIVRPSINKRIGRVVRAFAWAVDQEQIPAEVVMRLRAVKPLPAGRSEAAEPEPIGSVPDHVMRATLPLLTAPVRGLVMFQRLTGCRADEACRLRMCDVDCRAEVWVYSPTCLTTGKPRHKTSWRGKHRAILIGPEAQRLIEPLAIDTPREEYLFCPAKARYAKKRIGRRYVNTSYCRSIARAIVRENQRREELTARDRRAGLRVEAVLIPHWSPLMLRHAALTAFKEQHGWRVAQELAGHAIEQTTRGYVEERMPLALEAVRRAG